MAFKKTIKAGVPKGHTKLPGFAMGAQNSCSAGPGGKGGGYKTGGVVGKKAGGKVGKRGH